MGYVANSFVSYLTFWKGCGNMNIDKNDAKKAPDRSDVSGSRADYSLLGKARQVKTCQ